MKRVASAAERDIIDEMWINGFMRMATQFRPRYRFRGRERYLAVVEEIRDDEHAS